MAPSRPVVLAAGALPWRERDGRLEVAVVHRPRYRDWSWPKGKLDPGESLPGCAVREVEEETGIAVVLGARLPGLHYRVSDGRRKRVRYWAARVASDDDAPALAARRPVGRASADEVDDVVWVGAHAAGDLLTRPDDVAPLDRLRALWSAGRLATRPLVVVRHGQAVRRGDWSGEDAGRPLTAEGRRQADALVEVLAAFGVRRVVTSPWVRCSETADPFVRASGVEVVAAEELTQAAHKKDPSAAVALLRRLLDEPDDVAVVTHRPVLGSLVPTLTTATRGWTDGRLPSANPWLATGEALVAQRLSRRHHPRLVTLSRHPT